MDTQEKRKGPGPVRKLNTKQYVIMLEEEPAEGGKHQPGGLSELIRRLLREAYEKVAVHREG